MKTREELLKDAIEEAKKLVSFKEETYYVVETENGEFKTMPDGLDGDLKDEIVFTISIYDLLEYEEYVIEVEEFQTFNGDEDPNGMHDIIIYKSVYGGDYLVRYLEGDDYVADNYDDAVEMANEIMEDVRDHYAEIDRVRQEEREEEEYERRTEEEDDERKREEGEKALIKEVVAVWKNAKKTIKNCNADFIKDGLKRNHNVLFADNGTDFKFGIDNNKFQISGAMLYSKKDVLFAIDEKIKWYNDL